MSFKSKKTKTRDIIAGDRLIIGEKVYVVIQNTPGYIGYARRHINLVKIGSEHLEDRVSVMVASTEKFRVLRKKK